MSAERRFARLSVLLLAALLALMLGSFLDYGITLDEGVQNRYGRRLVRFYATLGADDSAATQNDLYLYGGLFELLAQGAGRLAGPYVYESRHLVNALVAFAGFVASWGLARRLGGSAAGCLTVLVLVLTPGFYGHAFANPKDVPFASFFALAAWLALRAGERTSGPRVLASALAIGLTGAVRVAGLVLVPLALLLWAGEAWLRAAPGARPRRSDLLRAAQVALVTLLVAWAVTVVFWPWALQDPLVRPFQAWGRFAHFWNTDVLWRGRLVSAEELPRSYLVQMLALKLPEHYALGLLLAAAGLIAAWRAGRLASAHGRRRLLRCGWVVLLGCGPIAWAIARRTPLYHECRHFLFVIPFLAVLVALGFARWLRGGVPRAARLVVAGAGLALALPVAIDMVELHPYQYVYFNRLIAGGLARAAERYETDYYLASYREGIDWLVRDYGSRRLAEKVRVTGVLTGFSVAYYLKQTEERRERFEAALMGEDPHILLASSAYREQDRIPGRVVHVVRRQGAPLLYVFEMKAPR